MASAPNVRFGDGTPCSFAASVLDDLSALVVYAGQAGRRFGDVQALRDRGVEATEKATAIRADLQRMLRESTDALTTAGRGSAWPEVREHASKAGSELAAQIERWQEQASSQAERTHRNLGKHERDLTASMRQELNAYLASARRKPDAAVMTRRLGPGRMIDALTIEFADALRVEFEVLVEHSLAPQRVKAYGKKLTLVAGTRKTLFGREKPRTIKLDDLFIVEAVLSPRAIDLRLAPKLKGTHEVLLLRLRSEGDTLTGRLTLGDDQHEDAHGDETLRRLWDALQAEHVRVCAAPARVTAVELDGRAVTSPRDVFECAERLIARWRPVVRELVAHTPGPDELTVLLPTPGAQTDEELWVRTADLTQHLLTIPTRLRPRLSPLELLGPARVVRESDVVELGKVMTPDAGGDSDVIALHYIPPSAAGEFVDAGVPSEIFDLSSSDISMLDIPRDPEENSGCYELSKLGRSSAAE
ncbi:MAG: hypothetical protein AAGA54_25330 [Myxococcota bacterium]